jgi:hypothetical protein
MCIDVVCCGIQFRTFIEQTQKRTHQSVAIAVARKLQDITNSLASYTLLSLRLVLYPPLECQHAVGKCQRNEKDDRKRDARHECSLSASCMRKRHAMSVLQAGTFTTKFHSLCWECHFVRLDCIKEHNCVNTNGKSGHGQQFQGVTGRKPDATDLGRNWCPFPSSL